MPRLKRNIARADEIRDSLLSEGVVLEDSREGTQWKQGFLSQRLFDFGLSIRPSSPGFFRQTATLC